MMEIIRHIAAGERILRGSGGLGGELSFPEEIGVMASQTKKRLVRGLKAEANTDGVLMTQPVYVLTIIGTAKRKDSIQSNSPGAGLPPVSVPVLVPVPVPEITYSRRRR